MSYAALLRKHARLVCFFLLTAALAASWVAVKNPRGYEARATAKIAPASLSAAQQRALVQDLQRPDTLQRVAEQLSLAQPLEVRVIPLEKDSLALTVVAPERNIAERWLPAWLAEDAAARQTAAQRLSETKRRALLAEIAQVTGWSDQAVAQRFDVLSDTGRAAAARDLQRLRTLPLEQERLARWLDEISRVRLILRDAKLDTVQKFALFATLDRHLRDPAESPPAAAAQIPPFAGIPNPEWEELDKVEKALTAQLEELRAIEPLDELKIEELTAALAEVQEQLKAEVATAAAQLESIYEQLSRAKVALDTEVNGGPTPRRAPASDIAWETLLRKLETQPPSETANSASGPKLTLVGSPDIRRTSLPLPAALILTGALLGAFLSPLAAEMFGRTISSPARLKKRLQLREVWSFPAFPTALTAREYAALPEVQGRCAETVNGLGSPLPPVLLVGSALPGEGKTAIAACLAMTFAARGEKTLLVELDFHRGQLHRFFGLRPSAGLAEFAAGNRSPAEFIRPTAEPHLSLLTAGQPGNGSGSRPSLPDLLAMLQREYSRIIIDTPPTLEEPLPQGLDAKHLGVIFVARRNRTLIAAAREAMEHFRRSGARILGGILNEG